MDNPIVMFNSWWEAAIADTPLKQKSAVCVSTVNSNGFPEGRFVDLKEVNESGFVFCSYFDSNKGKHIAQSPKVSLTVWWDHVGYQIRVVGFADKISQIKASKYWQARSRDAQLSTSCFEQSQAIFSESDLSKRFEEKAIEIQDKELPMPENWGGYLVKPISVEFLTFNENRLHLREFYVKENGSWSKSLLQP